MPYLYILILSLIFRIADILLCQCLENLWKLASLLSFVEKQDM